MKQPIVAVVILILLLLPVCLVAGEKPLAPGASLPTCHGQDLATAAQRANNGAFSPCRLAEHPTLADANLVWNMDYYKVAGVEMCSEWFGAHNTSDPEWSKATEQMAVVSRLIKQWETTGIEPATWRKEQLVFDAMAEKANRGPGRLLTATSHWTCASSGHAFPYHDQASALSR